MGRYIGPQCRLCRAEGRKLFLKGEKCQSAKCPIALKRPLPGKGLNARTKKPSNYAIQLREKQKLKRIYGMSETQFRRFFSMAEKMAGKTGDNLVTLLECRLDTVVYRMHFASSRKQARQIIDHGHVLVNGKKVNIPSYLVKEGDKIEIKEKSKKALLFKENLKEYTRSGVMPWLEVDPDNLSGLVKLIPQRSDVVDLADIKEQLIVELYSK
ncbi:30S ribosomal protein S4 [Spirochaetia bacterium 38H-sp]|uniref:Small ribosomal subunit protein uS4 n=1 Tax=Rarispira pelagica TaxID=3141764 RepID=A0ABU9UDE3_9SPIR